MLRADSAFTMARLSTHQHDEALDIVQDTMIKLVTAYSNKPEDQWRPLFYRILNNKLNDWHRKRTVRKRFHFWAKDDDDDNTEHDAAYAAADDQPTPSIELQNRQSMEQVEAVVSKLPQRQQQAFLLREWEGLSVRETAVAMQCSEGSVKTHLHRAMTTLRQQLQ